MVVVSLASVVVVIFVCVFLWLVFPGFFGRRGRGFYKASSKSRKRGPPSLLLVGPMNAGKTSLLLAMQRSQSCANGDSSALIPDTVTSMEVNEMSVAKVDGKTMAVVDIPGHPRLSALVQEYAQRAKIVAFVIDSADFANRAREVAEALVDIMELANRGSRVGRYATVSCRIGRKGSGCAHLAAEDNDKATAVSSNASPGLGK